jgi:dTDP-4-amino-4,6-dideoxygalactose transaminase
LLVARDAQAILDARIYSNFGTFDRIAAVEGSNTKMSEFHAAVGLRQAERWASIKRKRRDNFKLYLKHLAPLMSSLSLQPGIDKAVVSALMLWLNHPIAADLIMRGMQTNIAFHKMYLPPLYRHPYFAGAAVVDGEGRWLEKSASIEQKAKHMPQSEAMFAHTVGIPFHTFMDEDDIEHAVDALARLMSV